MCRARHVWRPESVGKLAYQSPPDYLSKTGAAPVLRAAAEDRAHQPRLTVTHEATRTRLIGREAARPASEPTEPDRPHHPPRSSEGGP